MRIRVSIFKEKKEKDFRMVILPTGINKIGLMVNKDYGIVSYLSEKDTEKIGELILFILTQCDTEKILEFADIKYEKKFFINTTKLSKKYDVLDFDYYQKEYILKMNQKDGYGHSPFEDKDGNEYTYTFKELPTSKELGKKVMEMFKYKENYDNTFYDN